MNIKKEKKKNKKQNKTTNKEKIIVNVNNYERVI
jgi:hypothetical protein